MQTVKPIMLNILAKQAAQIGPIMLDLRFYYSEENIYIYIYIKAYQHSKALE
jgi:hypothetical protein